MAFPAFSSIRDRCASRFGDESHNVITDAQWKDYVNDAYRDVQAVRPDWPWMQTKTSTLSIAANTRATSLPTGQTNVTSVYNTTDEILVRNIQGALQHLRLYPDQDETGSVQHYRLQANKIEVYPLADHTTTLIVEGTIPVTDLSADADVPAFAMQFASVLVEWALAKAYRDDDNHAQSDKHQAAGDAVVQAMVMYYLDAREDGYPQIVDDFFA